MEAVGMPTGSCEVVFPVDLHECKVSKDILKIRLVAHARHHRSTQKGISHLYPKQKYWIFYGRIFELKCEKLAYLSITQPSEMKRHIILEH